MSPRYPESMLAELPWSFAEPLPASAIELLDALTRYAERIGAPISPRELLKVFPGEHVDLRYEVATPLADGQIRRKHQVVRVAAEGRPLTHVEILFELHRAAQRDLAHDAHHYFEGLFLLPDPYEVGVPAYDVFLGS
ncbi:MAG: hypothetical protein ING59_17170 [Burkholderiales bacterium]|jgi:hypothetical protein|nr:hypothetical protein [Burkholderiales bacterium]